MLPLSLLFLYEPSSDLHPLDSCKHTWSSSAVARMLTISYQSGVPSDLIKSCSRVHQKSPIVIVLLDLIFKVLNPEFDPLSIHGIQIEVIQIAPIQGDLRAG